VRPNAQTAIRELHSVDSTDAPTGKRDLLADDATEASLIGRELRAVTVAVPFEGVAFFFSGVIFPVHR
jgi:hypothetical protein